MSLKNFMKVMKRDLAKKGILLAEPAPKQEVAPESWESFREHSSTRLPTRSGINRQFFQYQSAGKYMTQVFNAVCSEADVQCTVCMDPTDFQQLYHFTNRGDRLVRIEWRGEVRLIEPGESMTLKARGSLDDNYETMPRITALNNGV